MGASNGKGSKQRYYFYCDETPAVKNANYVSTGAEGKEEHQVAADQFDDWPMLENKLQKDVSHVQLKELKIWHTKDRIDGLQASYSINNGAVFDLPPHISDPVAVAGRSCASLRFSGREYIQEVALSVENQLITSLAVTTNHWRKQFGKDSKPDDMTVIRAPKFCGLVAFHGSRLESLLGLGAYHQLILVEGLAEQLKDMEQQEKLDKDVAEEKDVVHITEYAVASESKAESESADERDLSPPPPPSLDRTRTAVLRDTIAELKVKLEEAQDRNLCALCMEASIDTVFIPCGHQGCCLPCAKQHVLGKECCFCRKHVNDAIKIYRATM